MSETTQQIIERVGLIPVLRAKNSKQAHAVVQAMIAGGVYEGPDAYEIDLFSPSCDVPENHLQAIKAFHQQASRLAELDGQYVPEFFRRYL